MKDLSPEIKVNVKLLEAVAGIGLYAGYKRFFSGDSRCDVSEFISWAEDFVRLHRNANWDEHDYLLLIEECAEQKIKEHMAAHK